MCQNGKNTPGRKKKISEDKRINSGRDKGRDLAPENRVHPAGNNIKICGGKKQKNPRAR